MIVITNRSITFINDLCTDKKGFINTYSEPITGMEQHPPKLHEIEHFPSSNADGLSRLIPKSVKHF